MERAGRREREGCTEERASRRQKASTRRAAALPATMDPFWASDSLKALVALLLALLVALLGVSAVQLRAIGRQHQALLDRFERVVKRAERLGERVEHLDGRVERVDGRVELVDGRVERVVKRAERLGERVEHLDGRVEHVDWRVELVDGRVERVDGRVERVVKRAEHLGERVEHVDERVDKRVERVDERVERVMQEVRYEILPDIRKRIELSILVLRRTGESVGIAFFVSPTIAVTVARTLLKKEKRVICVQASLTEQVTHKFDVVARDDVLGFAVLELASDEQPVADYLSLPSRPVDDCARQRLFLFTCHISISMAQKRPEVISVGIACHIAHLTCTHGRHVLISADTFNGDSDGAVVLSRTGEVIALHQELVNRARERLEQRREQRRSVDARQNERNASLESLVKAPARGCLALRMDIPEIRASMEPREPPSPPAA